MLLQNIIDLFIDILTFTCSLNEFGYVIGFISVCFIFEIIYELVRL